MAGNHLEPSDHSEFSPGSLRSAPSPYMFTVAPLQPLQAAGHSEWSRSVAASLLRLRNVPVTGE
jgi:hypothetical protein